MGILKSCEFREGEILLVSFALSKYHLMMFKTISQLGLIELGYSSFAAVQPPVSCKISQNVGCITASTRTQTKGKAIHSLNFWYYASTAWHHFTAFGFLIQ